MHGSVNLIAINVASLDISVPFYQPLLEFLNYHQIEDLPHVKTWRGPDGTLVSLFPVPGKLSSHHNESEAPGLHHIAFNATSRDAVDRACELLEKINADVVDGPQEYPYAPGYYAVYFLDPNAIKLAIVHVPRDSIPMP